MRLYNVSVAAVGNFSEEIGYPPSSTTRSPEGSPEVVDVAVGPGKGSFIVGLSKFQKLFSCNYEKNCISRVGVKICNNFVTSCQALVV